MLKVEQRARLKIILNVDERQLDVIQKLTSPTTKWAKLKEPYKPKDATTKLTQ